MPNRPELKIRFDEAGRRISLKGIRRVIQVNKRIEAESRNSKTKLKKRSRKTDAWKQFIPKKAAH